MRYWSGAFRELVSRGVQVTVFTRDHSAQPQKAALVEELRAAGCRVEQRERMHEKVLIVDEAVLWHGSLNLLCGTGPTDLMMRITDGAACQRVRRIIDRARPERRTTAVRREGHPGAADQPPAAKAPSVGSGSNSVPSTVDGPAPGAEIGGRLYLNVPFADKDRAKSDLGARWDRDAKLWWVTPDKRAAAQRWLPSE